MSKSEKIRLVVINENILAYSISGSKSYGVLHASVLRGATCNPHSGFHQEPESIRLATEKDFDEFRVHFEGYKNDPDYEYARS